MAADKPSLRKMATLGLPEVLGILRGQIKAGKPRGQYNPSWETPPAEFVVASLALSGKTGPTLADFVALASILRDEGNDPWRARAISD